MDAMPHGTAGESKGEFEKLKMCKWVVQKPERSKERDVCECDNQSRCTDDSCFNRMLYIECYASLCPCGTKCANRRFQTGRSVRTEKFDAGKKGWGLRPLDQIPSGAFIGEYVGEVISPDMVADRKIEYKEKGHTHHFFMNLSPTEIIDATAMGSITRFINHSCEPNCELQKWTVNGEFRLGFFTTRPVDALEEVTFDYQYERGDIEQECFCGSEMCRGLITAATKADRKASGGGSGKRRRLDPAVKAERDLEALRKRLRKLTGTGGAVGYAAESEEIGGVGKVKSILDLLRMMIQNDGGDDQKMEFLAVLQNTEAEACLDQFLKIRGLRTLSNWLAALTTPEAKYAMMKVLDHLTIATTNVVDTSGIRPALESISSLENPSEGDEELPTLARNLLAKWSTLRTVYVIAKVDTGTVTKEIAIPRSRLKEFQTTTLRSLSATCVGATGDLSRDNSNSESRGLNVTGPENAVDAFIARVKELLSVEVKSPEHERRKSSVGTDDGSGSPSSKRRRLSDVFSGNSSAAKQPLPIMENPDPLPIAISLDAGNFGTTNVADSAPPSSTQQNEQPLPLPWTSVWNDEAGAYYYWNETTDETRWERPVVSDGPPQLDASKSSGSGNGSKSGSKSGSSAAKESEEKKQFRAAASKQVIKILQRYTKPDCKIGRITNNDDFKHLARKISHHVLEKEFAAAAKSGKLEFSEEVKHKLKNFVKSFMQKTGAAVYVGKHKSTEHTEKKRKHSSSSSKGADA